MLIAATSGSDLDIAKSALLQRLTALPTIRRITIIDDNERDAKHISAVLHLLLGRHVEIVHQRNIAVAIQKLRDEMPDLLILDDHLPPLDRAESSLRSLQRFGFKSPFLIISGTVTRSRRAELAILNPLAILEKDEINTFTVAEALCRLVSPGE
ncbi:MAG: response regulator [Hyphomicrobium sp.]